jgi:fermentation-respiration switch protein FrsA (DUF1100 family)
MPVLIIHSTEDEIIPFSQGQALYQAARDPKSLLRIRGSHNTGIFESWASYRTGWDEFIHFCIEHWGQVG